MSRTWTRATALTICGGPCDRFLKRGDPMLVIRIASVDSDRAFRRCATCAGEPVPADLPPLKEPEPIKPMVHIRTGVGALPFDFKMASAGRDPGEDDE